MIRFIKLIVSKSHLIGWQFAISAVAGLVCFASMFGVYFHLSRYLPSESDIYSKTGLYVRQKWERGPITSSLGSESLFCMATAFRFSYCTFEAEPQTVTVILATFPRIWGDVDVVLEARTDRAVLLSSNLATENNIWKKQSIFDCYYYSILAAIFSFLTVRFFVKNLKGIDK